MAVAVQHDPATSHALQLIGYDSWDEFFHDLEIVDTAWFDDQADRGIKAMRLATTVAIYKALLADQPVPVEQLDPVWRKRYGL